MSAFAVAIGGQSGHRFISVKKEQLLFYPWLVWAIYHSGKEIGQSGAVSARQGGVLDCGP